MAIILDDQKVETIKKAEIAEPSILKGEQEIKETTELGESLRELNNDNVELDNRMSGIDMRSRLHKSEISGILAVDLLVAFRMLPIDCLLFTRQKKRLSVSLEGKGRTEIVDLVAGKKEHEEKKGNMGMMDRAKSFFGVGS